MKNTEGTVHKNVLLLVSPKCRSGGAQYQNIIETLKENNYRILNNIEASDVDPNEVIRQFKDEADVVIIGGGDGSVNLSLPALIETGMPLLVIPLGTANNLARSYDLPFEIDEAISLLKESEVVPIDVGKVNDKYFVNVAGLGLSTEINRKVSSHLKRYLGVFAFILTGLRLVFQMNPFRAQIIVGDEVVHSKSWQISVCNGKHYGSGLVIKDDAGHEDQRLHLLSTEVKKWWKGVSLIPSLMTGRYKKEQEITLLAGQEIKIETRRRLHVDVDGDIKTQTPAVFKVLPRALNLVVSPSN